MRNALYAANDLRSGITEIQDTFYATAGDGADAFTSIGAMADAANAGIDRLNQGVLDTAAAIKVLPDAAAKAGTAMAALGGGKSPFDFEGKAEAPGLSDAIQASLDAEALLAEERKRQHEEFLQQQAEKSAAMRSTISEIRGYVDSIGSVFAAVVSGQQPAVAAFVAVGNAALDAAMQALEGWAASAAGAAFAANIGLGPFGMALAVGAAGAAMAFVKSLMAGLVKAETGGIVTGGVRGRDSIPALLSPGELIIPANLTRDILGLAHGVAPARRSPVLGFAGGGLVPRGGGAGRTVNVNLSLTAPIGNPQTMTKSDIRTWFMSVNETVEDMIRDNQVLRGLVRS